MRFARLAMALGALAACDHRPPEPKVEQARLMLPVVEGRPGSAYFIARSREGGRLLGITSPRVERIELHETRTENGVSRMAQMQSVPFDDIGEIDFSPGGKHAMLFGIDPAVKAGDEVPLTFRFDTGPPITVEAQVLAFGSSEGHAGH